MNCDWVKENVVLYIYDELADDARHTFEHHVLAQVAPPVALRGEPDEEVALPSRGAAVAHDFLGRGGA